MKHYLTLWLLALGVCTSSPACALLTKASPQVPRYFTPQDRELPKADAPAQPAMKVRLGAVTGASNLRERIAYRTSERELRYYEYRRWTERPDSYLEQALAQSLFEQHGLTLVLSGAAPTLEAELTSFEEITSPPHRVRVEVRVVLQYDSVARLYETIRVEKKVPVVTAAQAPEAVVEALATALHETVERVAQRTTATLSTIEAEASAAAKGSETPATGPNQR